MTDNQYTIRITKGSSDSNNLLDQTSQSTNILSSATQQARNISEKESITSKYIATQIATRALTYGLANYGSITGDNVGQQNINNIMQFVSMAGAYAINPVLGIVNTVITIGSEATSQYLDISKKQYQVDILRARTGAISTSGGRR